MAALARSGWRERGRSARRRPRRRWSRRRAGDGHGLDVLELAVRTAMTQLGAHLLEGLLAADTGHRGPRIDCGSRSPPGAG